MLRILIERRRNIDRIIAPIDFARHSRVCVVTRWTSIAEHADIARHLSPNLMSEIRLSFQFYPVLFLVISSGFSRKSGTKVDFCRRDGLRSVSFDSKDSLRSMFNRHSFGNSKIFLDCLSKMSESANKENGTEPSTKRAKTDADTILDANQLLSVCFEFFCFPSISISNFRRSKPRQDPPNSTSMKSVVSSTNLRKSLRKIKSSASNSPKNR